MNPPRIFLSNDDGIRSPGLLAAVEAVADLGEIIVVAPIEQQTGMGRAIKGNPKSSLTPFDMGLTGYNIRAYHCDCTPAMAVHHGILAVCSDRKPDLVISGINYGENIGTGITASGTVGAAMEGANIEIPSLAVSKETDPGDYHEYTEQDWRAAAYFTGMFARLMLRADLPSAVDLLNLNVPKTATPETPWRLTHLSRKRYWNSFLEDPGPHSRIEDTKVTIKNEPEALDPESDVYAITVDRIVSLTPMTLDFSLHNDMEGTMKALTTAIEN